MSSQSNFRSYLREFSKSKSGMAGLIMLMVLLIISLYVLAAYPSSIGNTWNNPKTWQAYPPNSPPSWLGIFSSSYPPTIVFEDQQWSTFTQSGSFYNYSNEYSFSWSSPKAASNLIFTPDFNGSIVGAFITWTKPDGNSIQISIGNPNSELQYSAASPSVMPWIRQFLSSQTGATLSTVTLPEEMAALFAQDGPNILNGPVLTGTYHVRVNFLSQSPVTISPSTYLSVNGKSYGAMGTDLYGRPIPLGILLGLPWALELGALTSIIAVLFGVIFGGISGFVGGTKDGVMQWGTLVFLALPALPFLIALSYSVTLSLVLEALLIAALSWPFYAIIARSVALSVRSQTYVEADKAMGISSIRTFFTHFMPRLTPVSIAYTALGIPAGILLAQTLAFIGIQPPNIVTWGGLLDDAFVQQAAEFGWWWWVLFPGLMIVVAAIPFVLVGFALDKIVAPKVSAK
jgi:peptide/nickel transport system permease protein